MTEKQHTYLKELGVKLMFRTEKGKKEYLDDEKYSYKNIADYEIISPNEIKIQFPLETNSILLEFRESN